MAYRAGPYIGGCSALALGAGVVPSAVASIRAPRQPGDTFRLVFLPDVHLMHDRRSPQGMEAALKAVDRLDPRPAFLVTGGDAIDSLRDRTPAEAAGLADLFVRIWNDNTDLPVHHILGNHDAAGWRNDESARDHPDFGYALLQRRLGMAGLSGSFDHAGWHFVTLHNIRLIEPKPCISEFGDDQMAWLRADLAKNRDRPTMIFGHFPPMSAIEFFDGRARHEDGEWMLSSQRMSRNPMALVEACRGANVRAFLSGHIHRLDRVEAMGLTFICSGSVSGEKWTGHDHETPEGITIVDCRADGTFDYRYHDYGWDTRA